MAPMELENLHNERLSDGDTSGSVGSDSGSAGGISAGGSGSGIDGSGRGIDGNDSGTERAAAIGADSFGNGGNVSADEYSDEFSGNKNIANDADANANRPSRAERERGHRPIRLGSFGSGDTDSAGDYASGTGNGETRDRRDDSEPVIRLGATQRGRPRKVKTNETSNTGDIKLSQSKDVIKMFVDSVFEIPAAILRQDFWKLSKEESKLLTDAIIQWLESMPKSRQSRVALFINENLPVVNLIMVGFFIVSERVKLTMAVNAMAKQARAFDIGKTTPPKNDGAPPIIKTPMDGMFS